MLWREMRSAITATKAGWAQFLIDRKLQGQNFLTPEIQKSAEQNARDALFVGEETLIATDQGVRGFLRVMNDLLWVAYIKGLPLKSWNWERQPNADDTAAISAALKDLEIKLSAVAKLVREASQVLASFDWRVASAVPENDAAYSRQASYRGSSGYREIRRNLLEHLNQIGSAEIKALAKQIQAPIDADGDDDAT